MVQDRLAAEAEEKRLAEKEQLLLLEESRKRKHREHIHQKIEAFHLKIGQQHENERRVARERERADESAKREKLRVGEERVAYRQELLGVRQEEKKLHNEATRLEEMERMKRLELLRQQVSYKHYIIPNTSSLHHQVQVNVTTDPLRVLRETKVQY